MYVAVLKLHNTRVCISVVVLTVCVHGLQLRVHQNLGLIYFRVSFVT